MPVRVPSDSLDVLLAAGLEPTPTTAYGNCLFNALSDQLYGSESHSADIRAKVVQYMREHTETMKWFTNVLPGGGHRRNQRRRAANATRYACDEAAVTEEDVDAAWTAHLERMAKVGTFADNLELQAFVQAFGISTRVYKVEMIVDSPVHDGPLQDTEKRVTLYLNGEHYSSVRPIGQDWVGLYNAVADDLPQGVTQVSAVDSPACSSGSAATHESSASSVTSPSRTASTSGSCCDPTSPVPPPNTPECEAPALPTEQQDQAATEPARSRRDFLASVNKAFKKGPKPSKVQKKKQAEKPCKGAGLPEEKAPKVLSEQMLELMLLRITPYFQMSNEEYE